MRHLMAVGLCSAGLGLLSCGSETNADPSLLHGRVWFEKVPDKPTEHIHALIVAARPRRGAFSKSSAYDIHLELFEYAREESKVKLTFPQSSKKAEFSYTIKECDADPFDLCLDLDKNPWGGPKRYYAKKSDPSDGDIADRARALTASLGDED